MASVVIKKNPDTFCLPVECLHIMTRTSRMVSHARNVPPLGCMPPPESHPSEQHRGYEYMIYLFELNQCGITAQHDQARAETIANRWQQPHHSAKTASHKQHRAEVELGACPE
jgi:hypothetical protein